MGHHNVRSRRIASAEYGCNASRAENEADFKQFAMELRLACDTCRATDQKYN